MKDGYYDAVIVEAWAETQRDDGGPLMACFGVDMETEDGGRQDAVARHFTEGEYSDITKSIFEKLELPWPSGLGDMSPCVGKKVRVKIKSKTGTDGTEYTNAYIVTRGRGKPATKEQLDAAIARIQAKDTAEDDPFA